MKSLNPNPLFMMYGFGNTPFFIWHGIFGLACLAGFLGLAFFVLWAFKNLKGSQLLKLSIALIVISLLAALAGGLLLSREGFEKEGRAGTTLNSGSIPWGPGMMFNNGTWQLQKAPTNNAQ